MKLKASYKKEVFDFAGMVENVDCIICFDIETTGLSAQTDRILSFSAIKTNNKYEEIDRINIFINPEMHIPEKITEINHISDETVKDAPKEAEAFKIISEFFGESPVVMGYNSVSFDERFINAMYIRQSNKPFSPKYHLDVFKMAKEKLDTENHKLATVSQACCPDLKVEYHNSLDDVIATLETFKVLYERYVHDKEEIVNAPNVHVLSAKHWTKSHTLNRLYIQNKENISIFYDLFKKEWVSASDVNLDDVKNQIFKLYGATSEEELVAKLA